MAGGAIVDSDAVLIGSDAWLIVVVEGKVVISGFSSKILVYDIVVHLRRWQSVSNFEREV